METLPNKSQEEIELEKALEESRESTERAREDLKRAMEALAGAEAGETEDPTPTIPTENKPGFLRKNWLGLGLATGIAVGGIPLGGAKKAGESFGKKNYPLAEKVEKKNRIIKNQETNAPYVSPVKNFSEEAARLKKVEEERVKLAEKVTAKVRAELQAKYDKELAEFKATNLAPAAAPKPVEPKEKITYAKVAKAAREARLEREAKMEAEMGQTINTTQKSLERKTTPVIREDVYGGGVWNRPQNVLAPNPTIQESVQNNPLHISEEMLEKVEKVYEDNIEKIFPNDTLKNWRNIKDKSAYELMSTPDNKVKKSLRPLFDHLKELEEKTGLEPKSGVRGKIQTIEQYIQDALQKAAKEKNLDEVKIK